MGNGQCDQDEVSTTLLTGLGAAAGAKDSGDAEASAALEDIGNSTTVGECKRGFAYLHSWHLEHRWLVLPRFVEILSDGELLVWQNSESALRCPGILQMETVSVSQRALSIEERASRSSRRLTIAL